MGIGLEEKPVPRAHVETLERVVVEPCPAGELVNNQRSRKASLSKHQVAALAEHGLMLG